VFASAPPALIRIRASVGSAGNFDDWMGTRVRRLASAAAASIALSRGDANSRWPVCRTVSTRR